MRSVLVPLSSLLLILTAPAQDKAGAAAAFREGQVAVQDGNFEAGIAAFQKATALDPSNGRAWHMLGYSLHSAGKLDEALKIHLKAAEFKEVAPSATYNVACVHSLKGDKDKAFEWLNKAVALGFNDAEHFAADTDFDNVRSDPRFKQITEAMAKTPSVQVFDVTTERRSARLMYFDGKGSPGQLAIDYGPVTWHDKNDGLLDAPEFVGKKWRFGSDFWTTLDTSLPLRIAGVEVPAGYWYLTLEHRGERKFVLGVHDPVAVRKQHIDAFKAELVRGGIEVPMTYARAAKVQKQLEIGIAVAAGEKSKGELRVRFGGHELKADVEIGLGK